MKRNAAKMTKKLEVVPENTSTKNIIDNLIKDPASFFKLFGSNFQGLQNFRYTLPKQTAGLYLLISARTLASTSLSDILYIGASSDLKGLWENHPKLATFAKIDQLLMNAYNHGRKEEDRRSVGLWVYYWCNPFMSTNQLYEIESYLISTIQPLLNETTTSLSIIKNLPMTLDVEMEEVEECPL